MSIIKERFMRALAVFLVYSSLFSVLASSTSDIVISKVTRDIHLKGKYVRITLDITLQNNGTKEIRKYNHMMERYLADNLIDILVFTKDHIELPIIAKTIDSLTIALPSLPPNEKLTIKVLELYKDRMIPKPGQLLLESVPFYW
eukprot:TRINITY_DN14008_c0_g1_i3.p2 TRINITY_DN14008_c0_g1~~TRINITY_DN14008_c0_g1_i3.p2  ORF type:complete len:144 (-),score=22.47 TRINITY_DN14008_c0_g1_i3:1125-1556(-)